jgi:glycosyltransferase involved in cell wall biosynthesis
MDPLCQTQSIAYLRHLATPDRPFVLITFEQPRFQLNREESAARRKELAAMGICWYPLTYHKRFPLLATGFDCLAGILTGAFAAWRHRPAVVHSRGSIPAAMALVLQRLCGLQFLYDADSRLSEEYADNDYWSREGVPFRVTARVEALARQAADQIVVLSSALREDFISRFGVRAPVEVIPCCVDVERFQYDPIARTLKRQELGLRNEKLFAYVGKLGPRYLVAELFGLFKMARERFGEVHLLILSRDAPSGFASIANRYGFGPSDYTVMHASHAEVPRWLSAADAGLALIRSAGCERGSSPVKIAEYLAMGLPVVVTGGIGDYSDLLARERVGVVLQGLDASALRKGIGQLAELWQEGNSLRGRCRAVAVQHVDLHQVGCRRYRRIYAHLVNGQGAGNRRRCRNDAPWEALAR